MTYNDFVGLSYVSAFPHRQRNRLISRAYNAVRGDERSKVPHPFVEMLMGAAFARQQPSKRELAWQEGRA